MSFASCTYNCSWVGDESSFTVALIGNAGDLFQRYGGSAVSPSGITPDWHGLAAGSRPFLRILVMDSDPDVTQADIADCISDADTEWYIDGVRLYFNASGVSTAGPAGENSDYAGRFRKLTAATGSNHLANAPFGGLEVCDNLVTPSGGLPINVKCIVALSVGSRGIRSQGSTSIRMLKSTGESNFCSIMCDPTDSFVLDNNNPDVVCKVQCWRGGTHLADTDFTRKWYLLENGAWTQKATTDTFRVDRDMIATFGDVKVECYDLQGQLITSDVQTVNDALDGYVIAPNPTPADGRFYQTGGPEKVTFAPKLYNSDGTPGPACKFLFYVMDSVGNPQHSHNAATTKFTTYELLKSVAENIGEGPIVNITAVEP